MKHSEISDPEVTTMRAEYIEERWRDLSTRQREHVDEAAKFLMLANSGGVIVTLSFMGALKSLDPIPGGRVMLLAFLAGVLFVGVMRFIVANRFSWTFQGWRDTVDLYYADKIDWNTLLARDRQRSAAIVSSDVAAGVSFACFVIGLVIGCTGLFRG